MKKIGILTFPKSPSFGASLQMYALYNIIKMIGHNPVIINYQNKYMAERKHISSKSNNLFKNLILDLFNHFHLLKFSKLEKKMVFFPKKTSSNKDIIFDKSVLDVVIVGSDQVWNPNVTNYDLTYFLPFKKDNGIKKISYAASFGVDEIGRNFSQTIYPLLCDFDALLVRELQAKEIIKKTCGIDSFVVLDPTMLLPAYFWESEIINLKWLPKKYICKFIFNNDKHVDDFIDKLSKEKGLPIVQIGGIVKKKKNNIFYTGTISQGEWLFVIKNANYIITDSFHGTVFSILFKKDFFVSLKTKTNSRLENLLDILEIKNRILNTESYFSAIDYVKVDNKINFYKNESLIFLKKAIDSYE